MQIIKTLSLLLLFLIPKLGLEALQVEGRLAAFRPLSTFIQQTHGALLPEVGLEITTSRKSRWQGFTNVSYLWSDQNYVLPEAHCLKIQMAPISAGVKYAYPLPRCWKIVGGLGLCGTWIYEEIQSNYFSYSSTTWRPGLLLKLAVEKQDQNFIFGYFIDYRGQRAYRDYGVTSGHILLGGFSFGGKAGLLF